MNDEENYIILRIGDTIEEGDEWQKPTKEWIEVPHFMDGCILETSIPHRRKITHEI